MEKIYGVIDVTSGYANGKTKNPKYQDLHSSGHAETVHVKYDASKVNLSTLLKYYFKIIDPTSVNKQGNDRGSQYRTGIYYVNQNDKSVIQDEIKEQQKKIFSKNCSGSFTFKRILFSRRISSRLFEKKS